jgi:hypothetical protein
MFHGSNTSEWKRYIYLSKIADRVLEKANINIQSEKFFRFIKLYSLVGNLP